MPRRLTRRRLVTSRPVRYAIEIRITRRRRVVVILRMDRPRPEVIDATWAGPPIEPRWIDRVRGLGLRPDFHPRREAQRAEHADRRTA